MNKLLEKQNNSLANLLEVAVALDNKELKEATLLAIEEIEKELKKRGA